MTGRVLPLVTTYRSFSREFHCTFAVDGPSYSQQRGGYWEPQDQLYDHSRVDSGMVLLESKDEETTEAIRSALTGVGLVEGLHYATYSVNQVAIPCPSIRIDFGYEGATVEGSSTSWKPEPMPERIAAQRREYWGQQPSYFDLRCTFARLFGVSEGDIQAASKGGTHEERVRRLKHAMERGTE